MTTHLVEHSIVAERLTRLRMTATERPDFRRNLTDLSTYVLFDALRELGTTTVLITHNADISRMSDRVIRLADGHIAEVSVNADKVAAHDLHW